MLRTLVTRATKDAESTDGIRHRAQAHSLTSCPTQERGYASIADGMTGAGMLPPHCHGNADNVSAQVEMEIHRND